MSDLKKTGDYVVDKKVSTLLDVYYTSRDRFTKIEMVKKLCSEYIQAYKDCKINRKDLLHNVDVLDLMEIRAYKFGNRSARSPVPRPVVRRYTKPFNGRSTIKIILLLLIVIAIYKYLF